MPRSGGGTAEPASDSTLPAIAIRPLSGRSSPAIARSAVVLPQPDGPSRHTSSPSAIPNDSPRTARFAPNATVNPSSASTAPNPVPTV